MSIEKIMFADNGALDSEVRIGGSNSTRPTLWTPE